MTRAQFWTPKNDGFVLGDVPGDVFDTPLSANGRFNWPPPRRARSFCASHVPPTSPTPRRAWDGPLSAFSETHEWKADGPLYEDSTTTEEEGGNEGDETEADVETEIEDGGDDNQDADDEPKTNNDHADNDDDDDEPVDTLVPPQLNSEGNLSPSYSPSPSPATTRDDEKANAAPQTTVTTPPPPTTASNRRH